MYIYTSLGSDEANVMYVERDHFRFVLPSHSALLYNTLISLYEALGVNMPSEEWEEEQLPRQRSSYPGRQLVSQRSWTDRKTRRYRQTNKHTSAWGTYGGTDGRMDRCRENMYICASVWLCNLGTYCTKFAVAFKIFTKGVVCVYLFWWTVCPSLCLSPKCIHV